MGGFGACIGGMVVGAEGSVVGVGGRVVGVGGRVVGVVEVAAPGALGLTPVAPGAAT